MFPIMGVIVKACAYKHHKRVNNVKRSVPDNAGNVFRWFLNKHYYGAWPNSPH